jgi:hypothetical protein
MNSSIERRLNQLEGKGLTGPYDTDVRLWCIGESAEHAEKLALDNLEKENGPLGGKSVLCINWMMGAPDPVAPSELGGAA